MNRTITAIIFLALLMLQNGCSVNRTVIHSNIPIETPAVNVIKRELYGDVQQHVALALLTANYYCENNKWPADLQATRNYSGKTRMALPVKIRWANFYHRSASWQGGENLVVSTPSQLPNYQIRSTHKPPVCGLASRKARVVVKEIPIK